MRCETMSLQYLISESSNSNQTPAPGNSFPGAGTQFPPALGKTTQFPSILNECDLSPAPGNSFPGAGAQLSPAPGKPTHLSSLMERMFLVLKRSSKLAGRRQADLSPEPERTGHINAGKLSLRVVWYKHHPHRIKPAGAWLTFPKRRQGTAIPGAGKEALSHLI